MKRTVDIDGCAEFAFESYGEGEYDEELEDEELFHSPKAEDGVMERLAARRRDGKSRNGNGDF